MTIRRFHVTVSLEVQPPDGYTGEIDNDIEEDVRFALQLDDNSVLGGGQLEVHTVIVNDVDDDTPPSPEEN